MNRHIDDVPFLTACRAVVMMAGWAGDFRHSGWVGMNGCKVWEDDVVRIVKAPDANDNTMEVVRPDSESIVAHVTKEGDCIRLHAEHSGLMEHIEKLLV